MTAGARFEGAESSEAAGQILATLVGWGFVALSAILDVAAPDGVVLIGLTVIGSLVASLRATPRQTAGVALAAFLTAVILGIPADIMFTIDHTIRVVIVGWAGALSVFAAVQREQRSAVTRRLSRIVEVAQEVMLRPPPRVLAGIRLAARYESASSDSRIGGDLYETAFTATGVRVVLGDVRGKGLDAVRLAATVLAAFREAVWDGDLVGLARLMDERVKQQSHDLEDFVTVVLVEFLPEGGIAVVNCGHHAPVRLHGEQTTLLEPSDPVPPLGLSPEPRVEHYPFDVGDRLLLATDGLIEARDSDGRFFSLEQHLGELRGGDVDDALNRLLRRVQEHVPGELTDDIAILLAERGVDEQARSAPQRL